MSRENALGWFAGVVVVAAIAIGVLAIFKRPSAPSDPPAAWWIRAAAAVAGTLLLVLAVLNPSPVTEAADDLFVGKAGVHAAGDAVILARLLIVIVALAFLLIPGTWMDVAAGTLVALGVAGFVGNYKDTKAILACPKTPVAATTTPDPLRPVNEARQCPTPTPEVMSPTGVDIAVALPKGKVVAPQSEIQSKRAVIRPVIEVRDGEGILKTESHKYAVGLAGSVPAKKLTADVIVNVDTRKSAEDLLADVTAAKTIYVTPY